MNLSALHHPKTHDLADALHAYYNERGLPLARDLWHTFAVGLLDKLWLFAEEYCPAGDVGKYSDQHLARAVGFDGEPAWLIETLVALKLLDRDEEHRLLVHDWAEHCPRSCDQRLADAGAEFADRSTPRRRPRRGSRAYAALIASGAVPLPQKQRATPPLPTARHVYDAPSGRNAPYEPAYAVP